MSALADTLRALQATFEAFDVPWYVFGAQAVAVRGAPRATQDVDVTATIPREQLPAMLSDLAERELTHRFPEIAEELMVAGSVVPLIHSSGMEVDLVLAGSGLEALAQARATPATLDGVIVPVAAATDLVVMKCLAGRGKDLDDVRALLASGEVDIDEALDLLVQLEEALGQSDLVRRLRELVGERR